MTLEWEDTVNTLQDKSGQWLIDRGDPQRAFWSASSTGDACILWDRFTAKERARGTLEQCQTYAQSLTKPDAAPVDVLPKAAPAMNTDPEYIANLLNRLRGIYTVPITDGQGPINGSMEFTREFPAPPINREAAELIEGLGQRITQLEAALGQTISDCQDLAKAHWGQHDRLRIIVEEALTFLPFRKTIPHEDKDYEDLPEDQRAP